MCGDAAEGVRGCAAAQGDLRRPLDAYRDREVRGVGVVGEEVEVFVAGVEGGEDEEEEEG